ncbi:hypothetical protein EIP91_004983, partial [Steccherinum ochraceum]
MSTKAPASTPSPKPKFSFLKALPGLGRKKDDVVNILVMGVTGTGKTTFVNLVSNSNLRVGVGLQSATDVIQKSDEFYLDDSCVSLVDTPGFDDTTKSETEVLKVLCDYLTSEYAEGRKLHGIIYFHRITDNRVSGSSQKSLNFFKDLAGPEAQKNCVVVTNMWNQVDQAKGEAREDELKFNDNFLKAAIANGTTLMRHDNSLASAQSIVRAMVKNEPVPLALQKEMVIEKKGLHETVAGRTLLGEWAEEEQKHQEEMDQLRKDLEEARRARNTSDVEEILEEEQRMTKLRAKINSERQTFAGLGAGSGSESGKDEERKQRRFSWKALSCC